MLSVDVVHDAAQRGLHLVQAADQFGHLIAPGCHDRLGQVARGDDAGGFGSGRERTRHRAGDAPGTDRTGDQAGQPQHHQDQACLLRGRGDGLVGGFGDFALVNLEGVDGLEVTVGGGQQLAVEGLLGARVIEVEQAEDVVARGDVGLAAIGDLLELGALRVGGEVGLQGLLHLADFARGRLHEGRVMGLDVGVTAGLGDGQGAVDVQQGERLPALGAVGALGRRVGLLDARQGAGQTQPTYQGDQRRQQEHQAEAQAQPSAQFQVVESHRIVQSLLLPSQVLPVGGGDPVPTRGCIRSPKTTRNCVNFRQSGGFT